MSTTMAEPRVARSDGAPPYRQHYHPHARHHRRPRHSEPTRQCWARGPQRQRQRQRRWESTVVWPLRPLVWAPPGGGRRRRCHHPSRRRRCQRLRVLMQWYRESSAYGWDDAECECSETNATGCGEFKRCESGPRKNHALCPLFLKPRICPSNACCMSFVARQIDGGGFGGDCVYESGECRCEPVSVFGNPADATDRRRRQTADIGGQLRCHQCGRQPRPGRLPSRSAVRPPVTEKAGGGARFHFISAHSPLLSSNRRVCSQARGTYLPAAR
jgi:hypothetical protein